ncbi:hypothetical protein [Plasticicumulans sp.]|uniref:hypothetical protein n=1 Tax=Plasticicumulans sp. TaxID=2307179 RepID=UPI0032209609
MAEFDPFNDAPLAVGERVRIVRSPVPDLVGRAGTISSWTLRGDQHGSWLSALILLDATAGEATIEIHAELRSDWYPPMARTAIERLPATEVCHG